MFVECEKRGRKDRFSLLVTNHLLPFFQTDETKSEQWVDKLMSRRISKERGEELPKLLSSFVALRLVISL